MATKRSIAKMALAMAVAVLLSLALAGGAAFADALDNDVAIAVEEGQSAISVSVPAGKLAANSRVGVMIYRNGAIENLDQFVAAADGSLNVTLQAKSPLAEGDVIRVRVSGGGLAEAIYNEVSMAMTLGVSVGEVTNYGQKVSFVLRATKMDAVNLINVTFTADSARLNAATAKIEPLAGFQVFESTPLVMEDIGGGLAQGSVILGALSQDAPQSGDADVATITFDALKLGGATLTITEATAYGIDADGVKPDSSERVLVVSPSSATTKIYSPYDVNKDDKVDYADLSLAFYRYQSELGDADWEAAKAADVNNSGKVDMVDLLAIYANFIA